MLSDRRSDVWEDCEMSNGVETTGSPAYLLESPQPMKAVAKVLPRRMALMIILAMTFLV